MTATPAPAPTTTDLGRTAEALARRHLENAGLHWLASNYRCPGGEIDLVMEETSGVLVLVEVRSRSRGDYGSAAESIGRTKRRRIVLAARHLLQAQPALRQRRVRFDVVAIDPAPVPTAPPRVMWLRYAFDVAT